MDLCPHCGCDLQRFSALDYGNVGIGDDGQIVFGGLPIRLTRCQHDIVTALVRARGRGLTRGVLAELVPGDVDDLTIVKYIERTRTSFRALDPCFDQIESMRGFGAYRWAFRKAGAQPALS